MLEIFLLGRVRVRHGPNSQGTPLAGTLGDILAYLVLHRHRLIERDALVDVFWCGADPKHAHRCLNTALWRLRVLLEPEPTSRGVFILCPSKYEVGFDGTSEFYLDTLAFEECSRPCLIKPSRDLLPADVQALEQAMAMYRADLAGQCQFPWILGERERLRNMYFDCQEHLMDFYAASGNFERSVEVGQLILENDPYREEVHRQIIRSYLEMGQRSLALRQYARCRQALTLYLSLEPADETKALLEPAANSYSEANGRPHIRERRRDDLTESELDSVRDRLERAMQAAREVEKEVAAARSLLDSLRDPPAVAQRGTRLSCDTRVTTS